MAKYEIYGIMSATKFLGIVEAESEEEAINKSYDELNYNDPKLCNECTKEIELSGIYKEEAFEIK
jgi:hypothetical protein